MGALWRLVAAVALLAGALAATDARAQDPAPSAVTAPVIAAAPTAGADGAGRELDRMSRDIDLLKGRIEAQDKRFDVQTMQLDRTVGWFQTFLTVLGLLVAIAGVGTYFSVSAKAKDEAKTEAEKAAQKWFQEHAGELIGRLTELADQEKGLRETLTRLEKHASSAGQRIDDTESGVNQKAEIAIQGIEASMKSVLSRAGQLGGDSTQSVGASVPAAAAEALQKVARDLTQKPSAEYTFDDWNNLAFAAYQAGDYERAAVYWDSAAGCTGEDVDIARVLVNRGGALGQIGRDEEAIATYDEVVRRYGEAAAPALQERVLLALLGKAVVLSQFGHIKEAADAYDEVVRRFGESAAPVVQQWVSLALLGKAVTLGQLGRSKEALVGYDEVVRRIGESAAPAQQGLLAFALLSKGTELDLLGRSDEAVEVLNAVIVRFGSLTEPGIQAIVSGAKARLASKHS